MHPSTDSLLSRLAAHLAGRGLLPALLASALLAGCGSGVPTPERGADTAAVQAARAAASASLAPRPSASQPAAPLPEAVVFASGMTLRMLAYAEQKRVEDQLERQNQQLRDSQRRIDQLNDRIEALRAIERSFARPNPAPAAPKPAP